MPNIRINWQMILMVCIIGLSVTNILLVMKIAFGLERLQSCQHSRGSLPCQAITTRFVMEEPECANKLLRSMNVTNVHIFPFNASSSMWDKNFMNMGEYNFFVRK